MQRIWNKNCRHRTGSGTGAVALDTNRYLPQHFGVLHLLGFAEQSAPDIAGIVN
jgi:hypothetical protein